MNRKQAFTLAETLITLSVMAVIIVLTVTSAINIGSLKEKKLQDVTMRFYNDLQTAYQQMLIHDCVGMSYARLKPFSGAGGNANSADVRDYLVKYLDGEKIDCSELHIENLDVTDASCASFLPNLVVAVTYNQDCDTTENVKEYFSASNGEAEPEESNLRQVEDVCSYVVYGFSDSTGMLGKDLFAAALGRSRVK